MIEALILMDPIMQALGIGKSDLLTEEANNRLQSIAAALANEWNLKQQQNLSVSQSMGSSMPSVQWLKENAYNHAANEVQKLYKEIETARKKDNSNTNNNPILKFGADAVNGIVNAFGGGNVVSESFNKWAKPEQTKLQGRVDQIKTNLDNKIKDIENQQIKSYTKNIDSIKKGNYNGKI